MLKKIATCLICITLVGFTVSQQPQVNGKPNADDSEIVVTVLGVLIKILNQDSPTVKNSAMILLTRSLLGIRDLLDKPDELEFYANIEGVLPQFLRGSLKNKIVLKIEFPNTKLLKCKEAFEELIQMQQEAHMNLAKHPMCSYYGQNVKLELEKTQTKKVKNIDSVKPPNSDSFYPNFKEILQNPKLNPNLYNTPTLKPLHIQNDVSSFAVNHEYIKKVQDLLNILHRHRNSSSFIDMDTSDYSNSQDTDMNPNSNVLPSLPRYIYPNMPQIQHNILDILNSMDENTYMELINTLKQNELVKMPNPSFENIEYENPKIEHSHPNLNRPHYQIPDYASLPDPTYYESHNMQNFVVNKSYSVNQFSKHLHDKIAKHSQTNTNSFKPTSRPHLKDFTYNNKNTNEFPTNKHNLDQNEIKNLKDAFVNNNRHNIVYPSNPEYGRLDVDNGYKTFLPMVATEMDGQSFKPNNDNKNVDVMSEYNLPDPINPDFQELLAAYGKNYIPNQSDYYSNHRPDLYDVNMKKDLSPKNYPTFPPTVKKYKEDRPNSKPSDLPNYSKILHTFDNHGYFNSYNSTSYHNDIGQRADEFNNAEYENQTAKRFNSLNDLINYLNNFQANLNRNNPTPSNLMYTPTERKQSLEKKLVELTYMLKKSRPLVYHPIYLVKYRLPYNIFVDNINQLLERNPNLIKTPQKLYQEAAAMSNVTETSTDLHYYPKDYLVKRTNEDGSLIKAKVLKGDDILNSKGNFKMTRDELHYPMNNSTLFNNYSAQAVDSSGNISVSSNKRRYLPDDERDKKDAIKSSKLIESENVNPALYQFKDRVERQQRNNGTTNAQLDVSYPPSNSHPPGGSNERHVTPLILDHPEVHSNTEYRANKSESLKV